MAVTTKFVVAMVAFSLVIAACGDNTVETTTTTAVTTTTSSSTTVVPTTTTTTTTTIAPTTTLPELGCGSEFEDRYERRFWFDGQQPAPLGLIWEEKVMNRTALEDGVVLSGILLDFYYGEYVSDLQPDRAYEALLTEWCFGWREDGEPVVLTFAISLLEFEPEDDPSIGLAVLYDNPTSIIDLLPFGNSVLAQRVNLGTEMRLIRIGPDEVIEQLVIGRQYVFEITIMPDLHVRDMVHYIGGGPNPQVVAEFVSQPIFFTLRGREDLGGT